MPEASTARCTRWGAARLPARTIPSCARWQKMQNARRERSAFLSFIWRSPRSSGPGAVLSHAIGPKNSGAGSARDRMCKGHRQCSERRAHLGTCNGEQLLHRINARNYLASHLTCTHSRGVNENAPAGSAPKAVDSTLTRAPAAHHQAGHFQSLSTTTTFIPEDRR